jgi:hypothetical protein
VLRAVILFAIKKDFYNTHAIGPASRCFQRKSDAGMMMAVEKPPEKGRALWLM